MTARDAWARLAFAFAAALVLVLVLSPPRPELRIAPEAAVAAGLVAGAGLAAAVGRGSASLAAGPRSTWLARLGVLALAAASEELLWRRLLLGELLRWGAPAALAGSTLAFALAHRRRPGLHVATGAAFGSLYLATGALVASVAGHWAYNAGLALWWRQRSEGAPP